jgi:hypothetical protein
MEQFYKLYTNMEVMLFLLESSLDVILNRMEPVRTLCEMGNMSFRRDISRLRTLKTTTSVLTYSPLLFKATTQKYQISKLEREARHYAELSAKSKRDESKVKFRAGRVAHRHG